MLHQGPSGLPPNPTTAAADGGGSSGGGEELERNSGGGNRWPRQETIALLKIRSDMDAVFKDSSLKGPLWEEVSRKLAELGYHRSAKKCKEKFENVYKYHRRTKDGRTSKSDGKTYRFFDQLEALETSPPPGIMKSQGSQMAVQIPHSTNHTSLSCVTVPLNKDGSGNLNFANPSPPTPHLQPPAQPMTATITTTTAAATAANATSPFKNIGISPVSFSNSSSSETSSDDEPERRRRKRKRKWKDFFGRLAKEVVQKQEELQRKFLDALEKRERDRITREEAWRMQEMAKMNREHELLVQERSITAAKDSAVIAFLQKLTDQQNPPQIPTDPQHVQMQIQLRENPLTTPPPPPLPQQQQQQQNQQIQPPRPQLQPAAAAPQLQNQVPQEPVTGAHNGGEITTTTSPSPSRWPKAEVQALIRLRTTLDMKYQENAPKGPLWEEISTAMRKLGYNRNAKRCKEKWENINKYYKKVKESNKKRPEDAKTCPYFHQLEQIYKDRAKASEANSINPVNPGFSTSKPDNLPIAPIMARPEQQWPVSQEHEDNNEQDQFSEEDEDDDEDEVDGYEVVTNKPASMGTVE
ncbi:hypothetical protein LguiA_004271 [Lonicera macranthoides]